MLPLAGEYQNSDPQFTRPAIILWTNTTKWSSMSSAGKVADDRSVVGKQGLFRYNSASLVVSLGLYSYAVIVLIELKYIDMDF